MKITKLHAREILDSRDDPTLSTTVVLATGVSGVAAVPSGASTGSHEALELRDGGKRYGGKGVLKAIKNVNEKIAKILVGKEFKNITQIDAAMLKLDGTKNKSRLGANAILSVSLAVARAAAAETKLPLYQYLAKSYGFSKPKKLPFAMMNVINGGVHADSGLSIQEFMMVPQRKTMAERVRLGAEIFDALKIVLKKKGQVISVGDEGGFAPRLQNSEEALKILLEAVTTAGYKPGQDVVFALDAAASEFYKNGRYSLEGKKITAEALAQIYLSWIKKYPLISLEDPFAEDDWASWKNFLSVILSAVPTGRQEIRSSDWRRTKSKNLSQILLVGDDLFVTNAERLRQGIKEKAANAILIKVNQIGTLSETIAAIKLAQANKFKIVVSHRSGETADTFIADLAAAVGADYIKAGSLSRSERIEKYNRLMEIEEELK